MNLTTTYVNLLDRITHAVNVNSSEKTLKSLMVEAQNYVLNTKNTDTTNFANMTTSDTREMMLIQHGHLLRQLMKKTNKKNAKA